MSATFTIDASLSEYNVPLATLQHRYDNVGKRLVIGVAIARGATVLVLQRAAHETLYPNMYELPGGKCEDALDGTLLDTVARETREETGLRVVRVRAAFPGFEYATPRYTARQFNFLVDVDGQDPVLEPAEHQAFAWVDAQTYTDFPMSDSMRIVVADALKVAAAVYDHPSASADIS